MSFRRRFQPPAAEREYRKLFVIAVEGDRTETSYFQYLGEELDSAVATIEVIPPRGYSAPRHVLDKLRKYFDDPGLPGTTSLWMVIDKDQNRTEELDSLYAQCRWHQVGMCVSNPAFPFWLLLHFEKGKGIAPAESDASNSSADECERRLRAKQYLPGFHKLLKQRHWNELRKRLNRAVATARELDQPRCEDYPRNRCGSTVYRLIESLLQFMPKEIAE